MSPNDPSRRSPRGPRGRAPARRPDPDALATLLADLPDRGRPDAAGGEADFADVVTEFVRALGYAGNRLYFFPSTPVQSGWQWDAVVAASRTAPPYIAIETKAYDTRALHRQWREQFADAARRAGAEYVLLVSPGLVAARRAGGAGAGESPGGGPRAEVEVDLRSVDARGLRAAVEGLLALLAPPRALPVGPGLARAASAYPAAPCSEFAVDPSDLGRAYDRVLRAATPKDKGDALEALAGLLFGGVRYLRVKYDRLHTVSSEVDLVLEYRGTGPPNVFTEAGRYALVECRNVARRVGAKEVRDFAGKLERTKCRLGFLVTRDGITGARGGSDAVREVRWTYDRRDALIVVLAADHYQAVLDGACFDGIIDREADRVRFDL